MSDRPVAPTVTSVDVTRRFAPGTLIANRYRVIGVAGVGGMGVVYRARDEELGVDTALKVLRPDLGSDPSVVERFRSELRLAREVSHKNVVRIHDIGEHEGLRFLTMRYVEGRSLREVLEREGRMSLARAVSIARQVASALEEAHRAGVVHRDLKPGNVLLDEQDNAFVTDFGVARSLGGDGLTRAGAVVGTPDYLSPEQIAGEPVDGRTDLYALGILLYEMLTGELPFRAGSQSEMLAQRLAGRARDLSQSGVEAPGWLRAVVRKLLERSPARRYPDAAALVADLDQARGPRPGIPRRAVVVGLLLAVALGLTIWAVVRGRDRLPAASAPAAPAASAAVPVAREAIAILPLADETSAPELAWTSTGVAEMLAANLSETGELRIIDSLRVLRNLRDLRMPPGRYDEAALGQLAELWNVGRIVTGTVRRAGRQVRVDLNVFRVRASGLESRPVSAEAAGTEGIFRLVGDLAGRLRTELGFTGVAVAEKPAPETASVEAARAFEAGRSHLLAGDDVGAAPEFEKAVAEDPAFAAAHERLAETYQALGHHEKAVAAVERAVAAIGSTDNRLAYRVRARAQLLAGRPADAEKQFQELLARYPFDAEPRLDLAAAQAAQGHNAEAVGTLKKAAELDPGDPRVWFQLGKNSILAGDPARAASDYLVRALTLHTRLGNEKGKADVLNAMGVANQQLGEYARALESYTAAAEARRKLGDERGAASTMRNRAMVNLALGRTRDAEGDLARARQLFEKIGDRAGLSDVLNDFGLLHEGRGAYGPALAAYQEALKIRRGLGDERLLAQSYDNVGYTYYLQGEYDNALVYWKQALDGRRAIGEKNGIVLSVQNMGFLHTAQGKWDEALKSFVEALEDSRKIGFKNAEAISLGNIATLSAYRGRYAAALESFEESLTLLRPLDLKPALAEFTLKEAATRLELNDLEGVRTRIAAAEEWLKESGNREQSADLETLRGEWHSARGEAEPARRAFARAISLARASGSRAALLQARTASAAASASPSELARVSSEAESLGHALLTLRAAEALARAELARRRFDRAEAVARKALALAARTGWEAGTYRLHALLGRALAGKGNAAGSADAYRRAAQEIAKLRENVPAAMRPSFESLPSIREALARGVMSDPVAPSADRLERIAEQVARITSENSRLIERVAESERRFRRISRGVLRVQEEERSRISRDLHDGIGQLLTALKIQLELLESEAAGLQGIAARIANAREIADTALDEVRQLSHVLRPQMLDELGLEPTLRWLARTFQKRTGIEVEVTFEGEVQRIGPDRRDARLPHRPGGPDERGAALRRRYRRGHDLAGSRAPRRPNRRSGSRVPLRGPPLRARRRAGLRDPRDERSRRVHERTVLDPLGAGDGDRRRGRDPGARRTGRGSRLTRIRVLLADDHTIVRQGLVGILKASEDVDVVGEAADGAEAVEKAVKLKPDVVVLDVSMPHLNGIEAARRIHEALPSTRVLVLTMHDDEEYVLRMVRAGASGYLLKDSAASELIAGIRALKAGKVYFGPHASRALAEAYQSDRPLPEDPFERLTDREREVFQLVVEGKTNVQIAELLFISPKTVDNHRTRMMEKLGIHGTAELVRFAAKHNLLR